MTGVRLNRSLAVGVAGVLVLGTVAGAAGPKKFKNDLTGYEEVPALSTPGGGQFKATINKGETEISYELTFGSLESDATQAHIHFENRTNNGPIVVFLCTNLGNGPVGTQACPADGGTITGVIEADDVGAGAAGNGIAAGELAEFIAAMRAGATYVNVHTADRQGGEIRAQLGKK